jgi:hypothetical protein
MNGPRRVLQVLAELRRHGVAERAQAASSLGAVAEAAALRSEAVRHELESHVAGVRAMLTREEQRLRAGLGTMADLDRSARYEERSRATQALLERQADRAERTAGEAHRAELAARMSLATAEGERAAAQSLLARREAEAVRRTDRKIEDVAEDAFRARAFDGSVGRRD